MANVLPRDKQISVLHHLVEGNTLRSTVRLTGVHMTTCIRLMNRFGEACRNLMDRDFRGLDLDHVEVDEVWSYVGKKQARLTLEEREIRHDIGDVYLWTAIDQDTKLVPSYVVGKRSADNARRLMVDLAGRVNLPGPGTADDHAFERREWKHAIQISTDGLAVYPEAIDLAFGPHAAHGVIIKEYRNANLPYEPTEMVGTQRRPMTGGLTPWSICTSHIERHNLTVRTLLKRFTRLSLGFSKKLENHEASIAGFLAYYNYVWRVGRRVPAAMLAGVVDRLWSFENLYDEAMAA